MKITHLFRFLCLVGTLCTGQLGLGQILLDNPSFEGEPKDATTPIGWLECEKGTTPDILPGFWGVYLQPYDGETYVGLITRSNGTWEAIGQRLKASLKKDDCYQISLELAYSPAYAGYNEPIKFRLWGGGERCEEAQLLGETDPVTNTDWKLFSFEFTPNKNIRYLIFEAYYDTSKKYTHNGNILIDNISPVRTCPRA